MIVSNGTGDKIDQKVGKIIAQAHMRAIEILKDNLEKLHEISDFLLKEETITGEQFMEILNKKPVENKENPKEESSNENKLEEKAIEDEIKTSDDKKENSSEISNEDLKKELEETLKENEEKSSDKDLDDTIALGSSEQSNQEDE